MSNESKINKSIGIGILICLIAIFICMVSILNKLNQSKDVATVNTNPISTNETVPKQVVTISENRIAIINTDKNSHYYGWVRVYEYDNEKKTFVKISELGE